MHDRLRNSADKNEFMQTLSLCSEYEEMLQEESGTSEEYWILHWYKAKAHKKLNHDSEAMKEVAMSFNYISEDDDERNIRTHQLLAWIAEAIDMNLSIASYRKCLKHIENLLPYDDDNAAIKLLYGVTLHNLSKLTFDEVMMVKSMNIFKSLNNIEYVKESKEQLKIIRSKNKNDLLKEIYI